MPTKKAELEIYNQAREEVCRLIASKKEETVQALRTLVRIPTPIGKEAEDCNGKGPGPGTSSFGAR